MREATNSDYSAILSYLKDNRENCLYMYINIHRYGVTDAAMPVWVDFDHSGVCAVLTKYYNSFRLQCIEDYPGLAEIATIINNEPHKLVFCDDKQALRLMHSLTHHYELVESFFMRMPTRYRQFDFSKITLANEADIPTIAKLISSDSVYADQCEQDELVRQIIERQRTGMGLNFIIRNNEGEIVVHESIMAQTNDLMIGSQFICRSDMRKLFLAETMENYILKYAADSGKELYGVIVEDRRLRQWTTCGAQIVGRYCKLILQN